MRVYVDTNVLLDFFKNRRNKRGRAIGKLAAKFLTSVISCKHEIVISSWTLQELRKHVDLSVEKSFQSIIKHKVETVGYSQEDIDLAKKENSSNWQDQLHIILARRSNSDVICTRNIKHFTEFPSKLPEELL